MRSSKQDHSGFTLIELLVVVAIIALLAAILFPVFSRVRENARRSSCQSNEKQLALGILQYAQDYDERLPAFRGSQTNRPKWPELIQPYIKSVQIVRCPSAPKESTVFAIGHTNKPTYAMPTNDNDGGKAPYTLRGTLLSEFEDVSRTWLLFESRKAGDEYDNEGKGQAYVQLFGSGKVPPDNPSYAKNIHFDGANVAFVDGHVKWIKTGTETNWIYTGF